MINYDLRVININSQVKISVINKVIKVINHVLNEFITKYVINLDPIARERS